MSLITTTPSTSAVTERELRRQIDRSVSRALTDGSFARSLLADPTVVLQDRGCTPQQYLELRSIKATSIMDFATQALSLFWADPSPIARDSELPLEAAAAI